MSSTPPLAPREDKGDLGLGRDLSNARVQRLLNADGTFNVRREGLTWSQAGSVYHDALTISWGRFLGWTVLAYLGIYLFFARFSRPTMALQFSAEAVIAPFNGGSALMFRIANRLRNELIELDAEVTLTMRDAASGGRRYHPLSLDRRAVSFLPTTWTLVHPITPDSPLWGMTSADARDREVEILVLMHGTDETFATRVSSRRSYRGDELVWGAKFRNILNTNRADGRVSIDVTMLDLYDEVALPASTAPIETV